MVWLIVCHALACFLPRSGLLLARSGLFVAQVWLTCCPGLAHFWARSGLFLSWSGLLLARSGFVLPRSGLLLANAQGLMGVDLDLYMVASKRFYVQLTKVG